MPELSLKAWEGLWQAKRNEHGSPCFFDLFEQSRQLSVKIKGCWSAMRILGLEMSHVSQGQLGPCEGLGHQDGVRTVHTMERVWADMQVTSFLSFTLNLVYLALSTLTFCIFWDDKTLRYQKEYIFKLLKFKTNIQTKYNHGIYLVSINCSLKLLVVDKKN